MDINKERGYQFAWRPKAEFRKEFFHSEAKRVGVSLNEYINRLIDNEYAKRKGIQAQENESREL